jgi:hypothetical protein
MSAQQLAEEIESIITGVMDDFALRVEAIQGTIYDRMVGILKDLELDGDGFIKQSAANRRILYDAENMVYELLPGEPFTNVVTRALSVFSAIDTANSDYFSSISEGFKSNRAFIKSLQNQAIQTVESGLLNEGLAAQVRNPLVNILNLNVNTGGQFSGFLEQLRDYIRGNEDLDGRLLSYSRGLLRDTLFDYSRAYQQSVASDLKLEWYLYANGLMDKSREFCIERAGKYFHESEIRAWASLDWKGKATGITESSIFILAGGYNCVHQMIAVHDSIVPKRDKERVMVMA